VGNEKGGSGKSTIAMHLAIGLLRLGYKVGTVDLDSHQATLTNYMKNRWRYVSKAYGDVPSPEHIHIDRAEDNIVSQNYEQERWRVETAVGELREKNDFIVIDTPGNDRYMNLVGHSLADILVTPINDSFIDVDLIAKIDPQSFEIIEPSVYTRMIMDIKHRREMSGERKLDWFLMRNRLSAVESNNNQDIGNILRDLQDRLGYSLAPGFSERVIFKELFLQGLTLLDLKDGNKSFLNMANIDARQEVRYLLRMILPQKDVSTLSLLKTY